MRITFIKIFILFIFLISSNNCKPVNKYVWTKTEEEDLETKILYIKILQNLNMQGISINIENKIARISPNFHNEKYTLYDYLPDSNHFYLLYIFAGKISSCFDLKKF